MKTALVTGVSGFVGWHMANRLLRDGWRVLGVDINQPRQRLLRYSNFSFLEVDLTDWEMVKDRLKGFVKGVDVVFHVAGLFDYGAAVDRLFAVNVLGTKNLLNVLETNCHNGGLRVIVWGAGGVFGDFSHLPKVDGLPLPASEEMAPKPNNGYSLSKLYEEIEALRWGERMGVSVSVIRLAAIYGPLSQYGMALAILLIGKGILPPMVLGDGQNFGALVHVDDVVGAALFLANRDGVGGQIFHVGDDGRYTTGEITRYLAEQFGLIFLPFMKLPQFLVRFIIARVQRVSSDLGIKNVLDNEFVNLIVMNSRMSNQKIKDLGYRFKYPDSLTGLAQAVRWYKKAGWLE